MDARAVDNAAARLRVLHRRQWERLGLAVLALGLAPAASLVFPALAIPLFLGGLVLWVLGLWDLWHRWDLLDRLAADRDAHVIPEVRAYAARTARVGGWPRRPSGSP